MYTGSIELNRIEPTATTASSMKVWGFEPRTEQMLNAGDRLQPLSTWYDRTHSSAPCSNTIIGHRFLAYHSTRVRGNTGVGRYCRGYRKHLLPTGGTGLISFIKGQGKVWSVLPFTPTPSLPGLFINFTRSSGVFIDAQRRDSNSGSLTKS